MNSKLRIKITGRKNLQKVYNISALAYLRLRVFTQFITFLGRGGVKKKSYTTDVKV